MKMMPPGPPSWVRSDSKERKSNRPPAQRLGLVAEGTWRAIGTTRSSLEPLDGRSGSEMGGPIQTSSEPWDAMALNHGGGARLTSKDPARPARTKRAASATNTERTYCPPL